MTGHKRLEEEGFSQITHVRSDSPYVNGDNSNRPSSRQHVGTEIAFHDVCYVVPVKEKGERHLKSLLNRVRFVKLRLDSHSNHPHHRVADLSVIFLGVSGRGIFLKNFLKRVWRLHLQNDTAR